MNDPLVTALHSYRFWRDIGADVLIAALLVEFLIEAWWPEHPEKRHVGLSRRRAMTIAAFVVLAGVAVERFWGTWADDVADQIRTIQEQQIVTAYERAVAGAPRELSVNERDALASLWRQYAGRLQKYSDELVHIGVVRNLEPGRVEEEVNFRNQLESVLLQAHFKLSEEKIPPNNSVGSGVYFDGAFDDDRTFKAMAESLSSLGIEATGSGSCVREPCEFWIYIGPKPIGAWWRDEIRPIPQQEEKNHRG
jgi:hypothetical protein